MSIFDHLTEKSWQTGQAEALELHKRSTSTLPVPKIGLRVFLAVVTVLFLLMVASYAGRMALPDWHPMPEPWVLWLNTAFLVLGSLALHRAWVAADRGQIDGLRSGLMAGGVFAFAFLAGQVVAWQQMVGLGYFAAANPANAFFYLITVAHALHLLGGLVAWGRTTAKLWRGLEVAELRLSVELCAIYWHFLLVVWVVLFSLLLLT